MFPFFPSSFLSMRVCFTAAAIIEHRRQHGPFKSPDGLLDVRGIGPAKLAEMRSRVTV